MRIIVNDIAASKGGAITILKQFYDFIKENEDRNEWIFLLGENYLEETEKIKVKSFPQIKKSRTKRILFDCFTGKKVIESYNPDVVVSLQNIITFGVKAPQIVYIHQSIPFQKVKNFSFLKKNERSIAFVQHIIGKFIKASAKRADKVFVQTEWMRRAVAQKTKIREDKIFTAFPNVELFDKDNTLEKNNRFFYPTGSAIYKNTGLIVEACNLLNQEGIDDFEVRLTLSEGTVKHKNIKCIGYVDRNQLKKEYQSATLIFPSYIETVGLPLLEARSCSTRILASDMPFSHECLEGYEKVGYFKPFDSIALKNLMMNVMKGTFSYKDADPRKTHKKKTSWQDLYKEILALGKKK